MRKRATVPHAAILWFAAMTWVSWNFLMRLHDRRVLRFMEEQRLELYLERKHISQLVAIPTALIAQHCNRSIGSTTGTLLRLEQRGKVYEAGPAAWLPGQRPQKTPPPEVVH